VFAVVLGSYFLVRYLKKKGIIKPKNIDRSNVDIRKGKKTSINYFNLIDDIRDNIVITENKTKYTTGVSCIGVTYDKLSRIEQKIIEDNYIGFWKMVDWNTQLYIQSRQMNVEENITYLEKVLESYRKEEQRLLEEKAKILNVIKNAPTRKELYMGELEDIERQLKNMPWLIEHKLEEIQYAKEVASPGSQPQFDIYILYSYEHDPDELSVEFNEDEVFNIARNDLEIKTRNIINVMNKCMVTCTPLTKQQLCEVIYRSYNLSDADIVRFKDILNTNAFDLFGTTDYYLKKAFNDTYEKLIKENNSFFSKGGGEVAVSKE